MNQTYEDIVIDAGYAETKIGVPSEHGLVTTKIPSTIAHPLTSQERTLENGQRCYDYNGIELVVGKDAMMKGSKQISDRAEAWLLKYMPLLVRGSADAAGIDLFRVNRLTVGLPIRSFTLATRETLAKNLRDAYIDGRPLIRDNTQIKIHCQGVGALAAFVAENKPYEDMSGLVIDCGGNTLLSVYFDRLRPSSSGSNQESRYGVLLAADRLASVLSERAKQTVTIHRAAEALRTKKFRGEDISADVDKIVAGYGEEVVAFLHDKYAEMVGDLDQLVLAGGGAELIKSALPADWQKKAVVLHEPEYANVRGYYRLSQQSSAA